MHNTDTTRRTRGEVVVTSPDVHTRRFLKQVLDREGFGVAAADDPDQAMAQAERAGADVVLIDTGLDRAEAAQSIADLAPAADGARVVALTTGEAGDSPASHNAAAVYLPRTAGCDALVRVIARASYRRARAGGRTRRRVSGRARRRRAVIGAVLVGLFAAAVPALLDAFGPHSGSIVTASLR